MGKNKNESDQQEEDIFDMIINIGQLLLGEEEESNILAEEESAGEEYDTELSEEETEDGFSEEEDESEPEDAPGGVDEVLEHVLEERYADMLKNMDEEEITLEMLKEECIRHIKEQVEQNHTGAGVGEECLDSDVTGSCGSYLEESE